MSESNLRIRIAKPSDIAFLIQAFDSALTFIPVAQWGSTPFTERSEWRKEKEGYVAEDASIANGKTWVAEVLLPGGEWKPAGSVVLSTTPATYAPPQSRSPPTIPELYVKNLITDRTLGDASKGVGKRLMEFVRGMAGEMGIQLIRLDCWRGGDDNLARCVAFMIKQVFNWRVEDAVGIMRIWDLCARG